MYISDQESGLFGTNAVEVAHTVIMLFGQVLHMCKYITALI